MARSFISHFVFFFTFYSIKKIRKTAVLMKIKVEASLICFLTCQYMYFCTSKAAPHVSVYVLRLRSFVSHTITSFTPTKTASTH